MPDIECQNMRQNRCRVECRSTFQKRCPIQCQNSRIYIYIYVCMCVYMYVNPDDMSKAMSGYCFRAGIIRRKYLYISLSVSLFPLSIHIPISCLSHTLKQAQAIHNTLCALVLEADFMGLHGFEQCMSVNFPIAVISGIHTCIPACIHTHTHIHIIRHERMHKCIHGCIHTNLVRPILFDVLT